jgi:hypothetical protein
MRVDPVSRHLQEIEDPGKPGPPFDIRVLIADAIATSAGQKTGVFSTESFRLAMARHFGMTTEIMTDVWCHQVLRRVQSITPMPGNLWKLWKQAGTGKNR